MVRQVSTYLRRNICSSNVISFSSSLQVVVCVHFGERKNYGVFVVVAVKLVDFLFLSSLVQFRLFNYTTTMAKMKCFR